MTEQGPSGSGVQRTGVGEHAEHRDDLPAELDPSRAAGPYRFPDNSRRRIPGAIYVVVGLAVVVLASTMDGVLVNSGLGWGGVVLAVVGLVSITSGWKMSIDEQQALARAGEAVGFAVGHASAQQVWRGIRSRPTWRVLCYSAEEPPRERGLVLVDAVDGSIVQSLREACDEDWNQDGNLDGNDETQRPGDSAE